MSLIEIINVSKVYTQKEHTVNALKDITLNIEKGEFVAIIGTSGSGKSTLLHIIGGIDSPTSGTVKIDGKEITGLSLDELTTYRRRKVGIIYQFFNLVSVLTVEENILLPAKLDNKKVDRIKLDELMQVFNLSDRKTHFPSELSGGQQQRVAIARAIFNDPAIILADEPTGNLDMTNKKEVINALVKLNKEYQKTLILVTHDIDIAKYADRIISISDGQIVQNGEEI